MLQSLRWEHGTICCAADGEVEEVRERGGTTELRPPVLIRPRAGDGDEGARLLVLVCDQSCKLTNGLL